MADTNQPQQQEKGQVPQPAGPLVQGAEQAPPAGSAAAAALQRVKAAPPSGADPDDVLTLQRVLGNRAVRRPRTASCRWATPFGRSTMRLSARRWKK
jgi:hypothetical protein